MPTKIEVNVQTGEVTEVELTPEEVAEAEAMNAVWVAQQAQVVSTPTIEELLARVAALEAK